MVVKNRNILTESEVNNIRQQYGLNPLRRDYIFETCVTVDGRYIIVKDQIFDNIEQKTLGNIWESLDMFKTIFSNVQTEENEEYHQIKENILSLPILEGIDNLYEIRDYLLEWSFWDDTWLGSELKSDAKGVANAFEQGWNGLKKVGVAISKGDWSEIWNLLKKGVKFILRKLKSAMYSTTGMIVDSILVATGVGKGVQWIPWALILGLDLYQLKTNDWPSEEMNEPDWAHYITIGCDILGLVFAGGLAKYAKGLFEPLMKFAGKGFDKITMFIEKSPALKSIIEKLMGAIKKVPSMLENAVSYLAKKFPAGANFIKSILGGLSNILANILTFFAKLLRLGGDSAVAKGTRAAAVAGSMLYGVDKGVKSLTRNLVPAVTQNGSTELNPDQYKELLTYGDKVSDNPDIYNI